MNALNRDTQALADFFRDHSRVVVLTGAGVSAGSGIPTYRDALGQWHGAEPVKHQEYLAESMRRRRYWARSLAGWPLVRDARPNPAHLALARLERRGVVDLMITQNVDRLHQRAGSGRVIDLHGRLDRVICLDCGERTAREMMQQRLLKANPGLGEGAVSQLPDGDADCSGVPLEAFAVPDCQRCGGLLMPDVVFFGGTVPPDRLQDCMRAVGRADALLAVGTSLQVYSGFRFCREAARLRLPIALVNQGRTRADDLVDLKLQSDCAPLLSRVADQLG